MRSDAAAAVGGRRTLVGGRQSAMADRLCRVVAVVPSRTVLLGGSRRSLRSLQLPSRARIPILSASCLMMN